MQDVGDNDDMQFLPGPNADRAEFTEQSVIPEETAPRGSKVLESPANVPKPENSNETSDPSSPAQIQESVDPEQEQFLLKMMEFASGNLDMSIECQSQLVTLTPDSHKAKPARLHDLGLLHHRRFELLGKPEDIEIAIESLSQAALIVPHQSLGKSVCLVNLGSCYRSRFERLGDIVDVRQAIEFQSQGIALSPEEYPDKPKWLNNLGNSYQRLFECQGGPANLQMAIDFKSQAIALIPDKHENQPNFLSNIGSSFRIRFDYLGELADIDKSIAYHQQAVLLTPDGHEDKPIYLSNLGLSYQRRYQHFREQSDIAEAIRVQRQALLLTPDGHADKASWLNNLGLSYQQRFRLQPNADDCEKSIRYLKEAVALTPKDHAKLPNMLGNLGNSHHHRFELLHGIADLDQSIQNNSQAVSMSRRRNEPRQLANLLTNLGISHRTRFGLLIKREDINRAIDFLEEAISLTPEESPGKLIMLYYLGCAYQDRMTINMETSGLPAIISCFERAALLGAGLPQFRFLATRHWARLASIQNLPSARLAYQKALEVVSEIVWIGSTINHRYELVKPLENIAVEAAAYAIMIKDYGFALEWLEAGRSVVWNQIHQLRTPLDELATVDPELANKLRQVAQDLELTSTRSPGLLRDDCTAFYSEQETQQHHRLVSEWDQLIDQVRQIPQFHSFMRPRRAQELQHAAKDGPIVVINVHEYCHALILEPKKSEIGCVSLSNFSHNKATLLRTQLKSLISTGGVRARGFKRQQSQSKVSFLSVLEALWSDVVKPIFDYLGLMHQTRSNVLPHITWCTTGPLSFLPLHAAGRYTQGGLGAPDLAISSYTPTLGTLIARGLLWPTKDTELLLVGQEHTKGLPSLPGTVTELASIKENTGSAKCLQLSGQAATVDAVLKAMANFSWVHFACHASQNARDPIQSAIHLHDGNLDLKTIIGQKFQNKGLAFLSACRTSTGDENIPDEAVHLAAGVLAAGYPSVIATMWEISDEDGPIMAGQVYARLSTDRGLDRSEVARALHSATNYLRRTIGTDEFIRWVPFVHFGV